MDSNRDIHRLDRRSSAALVLLLAATLICTQRLRADEADFAQRLEKAVAQTESELQAEKDRVREEGQTRQQEIDRIRAECAKLSDEIVERRLAIAHKQTALRLIRKQRENLWAERTRWQEDLSQIRLICSEIEAELTELMNLMPVSEHRQSQIQQLSKLGGALAEDRTDGMIDSAFALTESLLQESRSTAVYPAEVVDRRGVRRSARLARVGWSFFAYHIPDTSQTAIAISDPYQEGGFRWHENLSEGERQAVVKAIARAQGEGDIVRLPIDVTGTMTAATNLASRTLLGRIKSGGVVMFPLAAVAAWLALLIVERFFVLMRESRHSLRFCERILEMCGKGDFEQAERLAEKTRGVVSRTLKVCLNHRTSAPEVLDDNIQETFLHEFPKLERFLPSIRMLSAVAPILGLLGTVTGIIATFDMITVVGGGKPRLLAGGISEALITTATGLIIAIPGLLAHSFLSGRIEGIIADTERFAASLSNLIKQHQNAGRQRRKEQV